MPFKEALILSLGPFDNPGFRNLEDGKLKDLAEKKYSGLCLQLLNAQRVILEHQAASKGFAKYIEGMLKTREDGSFCWTSYIRGLGRDPYHTGKAGDKIRGHVMPLLKNNLVFDRTAPGGGVGRYAKYFLCVEVTDEDLPLDVNETD